MTLPYPDIESLQQVTPGDEVAAAIVNDPTANLLENDIYLEDLAPTAAQKAALDGANAPSEENPFATVDDLDQRSGPTVQDLAELTAIPALDRVHLQARLVVDLGVYYRWNENDTTAPDGDLVVVPDDYSEPYPPGRWLKVSDVTSDHNALTGIQGGSASERYHLTATQTTDLDALIASGAGAATSKVKVSAADTAANYLENKIVGSGGVTTGKTGSGDESLGVVLTPAGHGNASHSEEYLTAAGVTAGVALGDLKTKNHSELTGVQPATASQHHLTSIQHGNLVSTLTGGATAAKTDPDDLHVHVHSKLTGVVPTGSTYHLTADQHDKLTGGPTKYADTLHSHVSGKLIGWTYTASVSGSPSYSDALVVPANSAPNGILVMVEVTPSGASPATLVDLFVDGAMPASPANKYRKVSAASITITYFASHGWTNTVDKSVRLRLDGAALRITMTVFAL